MSLSLVTALVLLAGLVYTAERRGAPVVLRLSLKGDIGRETRWLAQYGQGACALAVAAVMWRLDRQVLPSGAVPAVVLLAAVVAASLLSMVIKRLVGRVRPGRPREGEFLGPSWRHDNRRESFPSSHSASAVAMSVVLSRLYPEAALVFWALALVCAALRYVVDAHWPSDVLGGIALGHAVGSGVWLLLAV
jgi:membrane-associated phospholipid phosphatase